MNFSDAFRALDALNEDTFSVSDEGIKKLAEFQNNDDMTDNIEIIDPEAETEEELQDSYVGKVILDCSVCHSKLYKNKEEVVLDEEGILSNVGEECPYCYTSEGFKVIGEVAEFGGEKEDQESTEETGEEKVDLDDSNDDSLEEGIFGIGKKKKIEAERKRKEQQAQRQAERERRAEEERERGERIARDWKEREERERQAKRDYERSRYNGIKGSTPSNTGYRGVNYSGGDYYSESLPTESAKKSLEESPVATLDRPLSRFGGTLSNVLTSHKDELASIVGRDDAVDFLNAIEAEVKNKEYLDSTRKKVMGLPDRRVLPFLYNIILKGDGMGAKIESLKENVNISIPKPFDRYFEIHNYEPDVDGGEYAIGDKIGKFELAAYLIPKKEYEGVVDDWPMLFIDEAGNKIVGTTARDRVYSYDIEDFIHESLKENVNNVNVETDDSVVNVNTDDNGKVVVTTEPKTNESEIDNEEVIVPVTPETQNEIENGVDNVEETDVEIDEFDEESFDELGESYLKKVYENVDKYTTKNVISNDKQIVVEGVISFTSGNSKNTKFIFEAKDFTKAGKFRFVGENACIAKGKKPFSITGIINKGKFITESFNYNYRAMNTSGKSDRIYGTIKR